MTLVLKHVERRFYRHRQIQFSIARAHRYMIKNKVVNSNQKYLRGRLINLYYLYIYN